MPSPRRGSFGVRIPKPPLTGEVARREPRRRGCSKFATTSQSASLTAPLRGEPLGVYPCTKKEQAFRLALLACLRSDRTLNLVGTQASCADIYMARSTVNDCLDTFDVGLPCTVRTSVRMGDLDTECYALAADIAFCHRMHLLAAWKISFGRYKAPTNILADAVGNCKHFFRKNSKISKKPTGEFPCCEMRTKRV